MIGGRGNPGSLPAQEHPEPLAAYADLQTDGASTPDVDWYAGEFDRIAEQTLGGSIA
jgi:hypothetical protein